MTTRSARGRTALVAVGLLALAFVAASAAWASSARVDVERGAYDGRDSTWYYTPEEVRVSPGGSVTWHNPMRHGLTGAADDHPTACVRENRRGRTNGECPWRSFDLPPGSSHTVSFPEEGTFQYVCALHSWMVGTVVVGSGAPPADEPEPEPEPEEEAEPAPERESDSEPTPERETATDVDDSADDERTAAATDGSEDDEAAADDLAMDEGGDSTEEAEADDEDRELAPPPTPEPDEQLDAVASRDDTRVSGPLVLVALTLLALALGAHSLVRRRHA